jgi:cell wall-associated NlpC family hydrolase
VPPLRWTLLACLLVLLALPATARASHETLPGEGDPTAEQVEDWTDGDDAWPGDEEEPDEAADFWGEEEPEQPELPVLPTEIWEDRPAPREQPRPSERPRPTESLPPLVTGKIVKGKIARLRRDGKAAIPRGAPKRVRRIIAAANQIVGKPYKWGGGHGSLVDRGYDCSGAVGYALIRGAALMRSPMVSGQMARWGASGAGRWVTVYAHSGHVYLEVAGLRLDTSPYGDPTRRSGVRWRAVVGRRGGFRARHPLGL